MQQPIDPVEYGLNHYPQWRLDCPGRQDPHAHVRAVTTGLLSQIRPPPDLIVVQGDTSSALGAALAGFTAGVPVAHVEAGLRTHDPALPWPEEEYRTAIDAHADLLFAPTELAASNLQQEQVSGEIHVTGNSGIDALLAVVARLPPRQSNRSGPMRLLVTCHRRESWGDGLESIAAALIELASADVEIDFILHPNRHVAEQMRRLLGGNSRIDLIQPCGHEELVRQMRDCDLILSDSGGLQEEAPALGTPLLVLRDKTERPEAIATGNARLVGTDTRRIVAEAMNLIEDPAARAKMSCPNFPYGDGQSGDRIAQLIADWLERPGVASRVPRAICW